MVLQFVSPREKISSRAAFGIQTAKPEVSLEIIIIQD